MIHHVYDQIDLDALQESSTQPVVVDFWAEWCAPCKIIAPIVDALEDVATVIKVNVDEASELAAAFDIRSIPTVMVYYEDGELAHEIVGASISELTEITKELVTHHKTRSIEQPGEKTAEQRLTEDVWVDEHTGCACGGNCQCQG